MGSGGLCFLIILLAFVFSFIYSIENYKDLTGIELNKKIETLKVSYINELEKLIKEYQELKNINCKNLLKQQEIHCTTKRIETIIENIKSLDKIER